MRTNSIVNKADGRAARGTEGEADADFAGAARDHERHYSVDTDQREQEGEGAEAAGESGEEALGRKRTIHLVIESAEPKDRQARVSLGDELADGGNGLLGGAADLDVEGAAGIIAREHGEEGLGGIVTEATVVEGGADTRPPI